MIDHISLSTNNFVQTVTFYDATLALLGYKRLMTFEADDCGMTSYGTDEKASFWIKTTTEKTGGSVDVVFAASSVEAIQQWYQKALELGAKSHEAPMHHPDYHPGYYGAGIIDPNGWQIEACLHTYNQ